MTRAESPRPSDPFLGLLDWYARSAFQCAIDLSVCWLRFVESAGPRVEVPVEEGGPASVTVPVLGTVTDRPILLSTEGFRAVGWGDDYALPVDAVTLVPVELADGDMEFEITVSTKELPPEARAWTIVYEGRVVDPTGADVCDVVHFVKPAE